MAEPAAEAAETRALPEALRPARERPARPEPAAETTLPPWRPTLAESIREAWRARHLLRAMSAYTLPTYENYLLGRAWFVLRPLMQVFGFGILLGGVFGATAPNGIPYLLFLVFSFQGWHTFQRTLIIQCRGAQQFQKLGRKFKLPLLLIPVASPSLGLIYLAVYWLVAIPMLFYYLGTTGNWYLAPPHQLLVGFAGLAMTFAMAVAIGIPFSLLYIKARDVRLGLRYVTQLLLFVTPVLYSIEKLSGTARTVAEFNPLTGTMSLIQYGFLDAGAPSLRPVVWSVACTVLFALAGLWLFNRFGAQLIGLDKSKDDDDEEAREEEVLL